MTPQTKKILIWSSVAVILGVGGYFIYDKIRKNRLAEEEKKRKEEEEKNKQPAISDVKVDETIKQEDKTPTKEEPKDEQLISQDLEKAIAKIILKGDGRKSKRDYLTKTNSVWVKKWAWAIDNSKRAFTWGNKVWRTKTGEEILNFNPIGVSMKTKPNGAKSYWYANTSWNFAPVQGNLNVGKVRAVSFDGKNVWFYLPDNGEDYKWGISTDFVKA